MSDFSFVSQLNSAFLLSKEQIPRTFRDKILKFKFRFVKNTKNYSNKKNGTINISRCILHTQSIIIIIMQQCEHPYADEAKKAL